MNRAMKFLPLLLAFFCSRAFAQTHLLDDRQLQNNLGLQNYFPVAGGFGKLSVAVFDNGFNGFEPGADLLPKNAELIESPVNAPLPDDHGLGMAQILWGLLGRPLDGPKFYLMNTNGFSNLKFAVKFAIEKKVDIILYSQNWTFGSNFVGEGFIAAEAKKASDAGIIWLNSAGNFHDLVYQAKVLPLEVRSGQAALPGPGNTLRFRNRLDSNNVTVTLTWNDFTDSEFYSSAKDFDLQIFNELGTLLGTADKIQEGRGPDGPDDTRRSSHAREILSLKLKLGSYSLRVISKSKNFTAQDQFRIILQTDKTGSLEFMDKDSLSKVQTSLAAIA